ncbi:MAG: ATP-binding cassette domain-containing protein [Bacteroidetes bacterium]|nr:ATP-binding cassette domain-containing protein [Bacteroidota bacterium]
MITASNIYLQYGDRILLDHVNFVIKETDKIGLVGRNGAGKSTLLKLISGQISSQKGKIVQAVGKTVGFLYQEIHLSLENTLLDEALTAFSEVKSLENKIADINHELTQRTDYHSDSYTELLEELSETSHRFTVMDGDVIEAKTTKVLKGLGFKDNDFHRNISEFSGGWQMRIELAKLLLSHPDYLLLDEPTNHLDIESIIWLEQFLKEYQGAVLVISHDKQFLDNVTSRTIEVELGKVYDYKASYSKFVTFRQERRERQKAAYENQQRVIAQKERTITRFMAKESKTKMAQSMQKQLDKIDRIEIEDVDTKVMRLQFQEVPRSGQVVVEAKNVVKNYGEKRVLTGVDLKLDRGERVAFVGQNGMGKTTLAKMIVKELEATDGEIKLGYNVELGYYAQNQSDSLHSKHTVLQTLEMNSPAEMRTRLRSILGAFMFSGEDVDKKVLVLSGGERARLAMACLLLRPFNLLVLDEPTNHLDILSKDILKQALLDYKGTLIVVSHDREFLSGLTERTVEFRDHSLFEYIGDVNAFLEKRALDNMREVEKATVKGAAPKDNSEEKSKEILDWKSRKKLQRSVQNAEKKIENIETSIQEIEGKMSETGFYELPNASQLLEKYQKLKNDLETTYEIWEKAQAKWEVYEKDEL